MERTFSWRQLYGGYFDGPPGSWADITTGTAELTTLDPTSLDIAEFNGVTVTIGTFGTGEASTVDVSSSVVTLTGSVLFGALAINSSTLDVTVGATLSCAPDFQLFARTAVEVGSGSALDVAGAGAVLTVHNEVASADAYLQVDAAATFAVGAGASVSADVLDLAGSQTVGALGSIDGGSATTDSTAELTASWLAVGDGGMGSLTVTNGALVAASTVTVGFGEAAGAGIGALLIDAAGQIAADNYAAVGFYAGDVGAVTLDGSGSSFASAGLFVGNAGSGALTVENCASLATTVEPGDATSFAASIANASGGAGSVLLTGPGSVWTIAGRTDIGDGGAGTLDVWGGAIVEATAASVPLVINGTTEYYGTFSLTEGTAAVQDAGSTINAAIGPVYVGNAGTASISITAAGAMTAGEPAPDYAAVQLGLNSGTGTLLVTDASSTFTSLGQIDVGGTGGTGNVGTLEVLAAATLFSGAMSGDPLAGLSVGDGPGSSGFASIDGTGSVLSNNGRLDIGRDGSGVLSITNGAILTTELTGAPQTPQPASVLVGVNANANGAVFLAGTGSALFAAQSMIVGLGGAGTLQVIDAAQARVGGDLGIGSDLGSGFAGSGTGMVSLAASTLSVGGALVLGGSDVGYAGTGSLSIAAGAQMLVAGSAAITAGSTIAMDGGGLEIGGSGTTDVTGMLIDADAILSGAGSVLGSVQIDGTVAAAGGVLALGTANGPGLLSVVAGGTLDVADLSGGTVDFAGSGTVRLHAVPVGTALIVGPDGGTIDLPLQAAFDAAYVDGALTVEVGSATMTMQLAATPPPGAPEVVADGAGGSDIVLACFVAGTRLKAPAGPIAVETVRVGDLLRTAAGGIGRVVWVGCRRLDCCLHPRPTEVSPVRVCAGAFAPGMPACDVRLSPDHALFVEGSLIPVRYLQNGRSIVQEPASRITYCHIELAAHDVLLAEELPCESFLDTGNRHAFGAQGGPAMLHPEFVRRQAALEVWAEKGCAPLVLEGPALERARRRLLHRAAALGHRRTRNPALRVLYGARALKVEVAGARWQVVLPPGTAVVRLVSRSWVPAHMGPAESDARVLGVAITRLALDGREVALDSPALAEGWHAPEPGWRWTNGAGILPVAGARHLTFDLVLAGDYWVQPVDAAASAAEAQTAAAG